MRGVSSHLSPALPEASLSPPDQATERNPSRSPGVLARHPVSAAASMASASANPSTRSFSACPACPFTHTQVTLRRPASASSARHRSSFFTGFLLAVLHPRAFQAGSQVAMPSTTYLESECRMMAVPSGVARSASIAPVSSIRLFVVACSRPERTRSVPSGSTMSAAHPPGHAPLFSRQAPSVKARVGAPQHGTFAPA